MINTMPYLLLTLAFVLIMGLQVRVATLEHGIDLAIAARMECVE